MTGEPGMRASAIPVLLYHSVADTPAVGQEAFTVTPKRFAEHVAAIADAGLTALTITDLAAAIRGERELPPRSVAVTFDDAFEDTLGAVERLRDAAIPSTVYVQSERIDGPGGPSVHALREMHATGAEIGAHTVSHPYLDSIPPARAAGEIGESRRVIEQQLEQRVASFAYPHGAYDRRVRAAVIAAGFTSAAAVKNALSHPADDVFAIARWTLMRDTPTVALARVLAGQDLPLAWARERHRTRAAREARRMRRRLRELRGRGDGHGG
ncbi:MAG: polysaccharide deacetylase family protein [Solirubrobacteraceae bacterium]